MSKQQTKANLAKVKLALAEKYERLAKNAGSKPKRDTFLLHAKRYHQQVEELSRK